MNASARIRIEMNIVILNGKIYLTFILQIYYLKNL